MSSSINLMDVYKKDEVVISNSKNHFGPQNGNHLKGTDLIRALEVSSILQSTLDLESLFNLFMREIQKTMPLVGLAYLNADLALHIEIGRKAEHLCTYRLLVGNQKLGEVMFFSMKAVSEPETIALENLLTSLLYPLRNAILYSHALQTALKDPLTGVNNRVSFESIIEREISLAKRHQTEFAVLMIDIDYFKKVNDEFGHLYGDCVLREVAQKIQKCIRTSDILFRYGGEEFVVLLSNTDRLGADLTSERIRAYIAKSFNSKAQDNINITLSIGATTLLHDDDSGSMLRRADTAMYQAKNTGRNCVCFATEKKPNEAN